MPLKIEIISKKEIKVNGILFTPSEEKPKAKKVKDEEHPLWPHFLKLWGEYGKKGNRKQAFKNLARLTRTQREQMYTKVQGYVKSTPDKAFRKDLQTWLNKDKEHWNDSLVQPVADKWQAQVNNVVRPRPVKHVVTDEERRLSEERLRAFKRG